MMAPVIAPSVAIALAAASVAGCSSGDVSQQNGLIVVEDYPATINAQAVPGNLQRTDRCVQFVAMDGRVMVPLFPQGDSLDDLERTVGSLDTPREVTVSGMTAISPVPGPVSAAIDASGCTGSPFFFGHFQPGRSRPVAP